MLPYNGILNIWRTETAIGFFVSWMALDTIAIKERSKLVNIFTDPKARKTPCSISLPNEMWNQIDEYILAKYGGRMSRSAFIEDFIRQTLEEKGNELIEDLGTTLSVNIIRAYIHRLKDFIATNAQNNTIGNLEAVRRDLIEAADFIEQVIRRSRTPTKSDKRQLELREALAAHKARINGNGVVMSAISNAPPSSPMPPPLPQPVPDTKPETEEAEKQEQEQRQQPDPDPADLEYEKLLTEVYAGYKEEPPSKPDFEIVDVGRTERNPYDKTGTEEVFK
jgi:hypothetical protein